MSLVYFRSLAMDGTTREHMIPSEEIKDIGNLTDDQIAHSEELRVKYSQWPDPERRRREITDRQLDLIFPPRSKSALITHSGETYYMAETLRELAFGQRDVIALNVEVPVVMERRPEHPTDDKRPKPEFGPGGPGRSLG